MAKTPLQRMSEVWVPQYAQAAVNACDGTGIFPLTILAQSSIESNWGQSKLTKNANNFYGIKAGSKWTGKTVTMRTAEQRSDGSVYYVDAAFRAWDTPEEGFKGIIDFLKSNSRYSKAFTAKDPAEQITLIHRAGYATDIKYSQTNIQRQNAMKPIFASLNIEKKKRSSNQGFYNNPFNMFSRVGNSISNFIFG